MSASLHHTSMFVSDMERSIRLFRDILGFKLAWHIKKTKSRLLSTLLGIPEMEAELAYLEGDSKGVAIEIARLIYPVLKPSPTKFGSTGTCSLSLCVHNLDELYARLDKEGWDPISACLELIPPNGIPARAFCIRLEPNVLLELIQENVP